MTFDKAQRIGNYIEGTITGGEKYKAYVPTPLPPQPPIDLAKLYPLLDKANTALGRLDGMSAVLPDPSLFLYMYVKKEAVLSSQIEGTQSSLSDLLLFESEEMPGTPLDDVQEVSCYVSAMNYGLERLSNFPLSLRLIREIHQELMNNARGGDKQPGEFRRTQNWLGGASPSQAKFVPPPPEHLMASLDNFERFLHDEQTQLPILVKAAVAHVQFETIHPFLDGNGRLGRLLITFILCAEGILKEPLLYLSLYFKSNRQAYYDHLQAVRETGSWEEWVAFFLQGVIDTSSQATQTAKAVITLFNRDAAAIEDSSKSTAAVIKIFNYLQHNPLTSSTRIRDKCDISLPTVLRGLNTLEELDIVKELTGKSRHKLFAYADYLTILNAGTEPLKY